MNREDGEKGRLVQDARVLRHGIRSQRSQMLMENRLIEFQPLVEHGQIDGQTVQLFGEEKRQTMIDQIDQNAQRFVFVSMHNVENHRCENVKTLTITNRFVVTGETEKNAL